MSGYGWTRVSQLWEHALDPQAEWRPLEVSGSGPSPRVFASAVYDSKHDRAILFGGFDGTSTFNEVWELKLNGGPRWSLLSPSGPAPVGRFWHSAIYDARLERMIIFGGTTRSIALNDVWALNLKKRPGWEQLLPTGDAPAPRTSACALYDEVRGRMLVVGGETSPIFDRSENFWELDLAGSPKWKRLPSAANLNPYGFGPGVLDAPGDRALFYDGTGSEVLAVTLSEPMTWSRIEPGNVSPRQRAGHVAVLDPVGRRMWVYGGTSGIIPKSDTWTFPLDGAPAWTKVPAEGEAERRSAHTAVFDTRRDRMVVFGGRPSWDGPGTPDRPDHQLWIQDFAHGDIWEPLEPTGPAPPLRASHTAVFDSLHDRMIVFGGYSGLTDLNDVWALSSGDHPTWTLLPTTGDIPSPRSASTAIYDPVGDRMVIFGGGRQLNDAWALPLHGEPTWQPILTSGVLPPGRREHCAVYDPTRHRMLIFGGITTSKGYDNDVWSLALDGSATWKQIIAAGPAPRGRQSPVVVYDAPRERLVVHGGYDGTNQIRDTWELSLAGEPRWRELAPEGNVPIFWFDHSAVVDPPRSRMVIFGDFGSWSLDLGPERRGRSVESTLGPNGSVVAASEGALAVSSVGRGAIRGAWELRVQLPETRRAILEVRTVTGRIVLTREIPSEIAGSSTIQIPEARDYRSGVYFLRLLQGNSVATTKVVCVH